MDIQALCQRIALPEPMAVRVRSFWEEFDFSSVGDVMERMMAPETNRVGYDELAQALGEDPDGVKILSCQLHCACQVYDRYMEMGISPQVYFDTMKCFTRFVVECSYYKGDFIFDRGWWTWRQLSMRLFRLGQLEYELRPEGTVSIHIPSDTVFTPDLVAASLDTAKAFLATFFPAYQSAAFTCRSWLLSPLLAQLLEEGSNILSFQRLFQIEEVDPDSMDYIPWLFQTIPGTPVEGYSERTGLQRRAKGHLLSGGKIGTALGILKMN